MVAQDEAIHAQVERVLESATLRNAETLKRLLRYLAEKSIAGEADQLKEYTVGVDALGKPKSYDPRQDSVVRIQIGRLRHKLADYYKVEGKNDRIVLDIPKGHFKLTSDVREIPTEESAALATRSSENAARQDWSLAQWLVVMALGLWGLTATVLWVRQYQQAAPIREAWTPELRELWAPIIDTNRPVLVAVAAPMLIGFQGTGLLRVKSLNRWEDVTASPKIQAVQKLLGSPGIVQRYDYAGFGEMNAALGLERLLSLTPAKLTTVRSSDVSWQQLMDSNVIFLGAPRAFGDPLHKLPVEQDIVLREDGVHDLKAAAGQDPVYKDDYPSIFNPDVTAVNSGEVYALVSRMPGPLGLGNVQTFNSNYSPGAAGAVQYLTNPAFAREFVGKLRKTDGTIPRYFQLVLHVKYRDTLPTEISYVIHRELRLESSLAHPTEKK